MRLYIDPGSGSMLLTILIGMIAALAFFVKKLWLRLKFALRGGKVAVQAEKLPYVIFSDSKRYWNVFEPVCDEFEHRGIACEYWTMSPDDPALNKVYEHVSCRFIGEDAKAFARLNAMKADICLSTTPGLDVFQWKRSKDTDWYAHVFHSVGDGTVYRMFGLDYYDAILASGTYIEPRIRKLEKIRHQPAKEFRVVGATFFDSLQKRVESAAPATHEGTTVLLAPSWGPNAILTRYGDALIDALIATGCRIIIRPHPQSRTAEAAMLERLQKKYPDGEKLSWNFDNDNFDVLNASDIMISDFSGVIFDYAFFFDRPILYADTEFDTAPYDAAWLEEKPWTPSVVPLIGRKLEADDFPNLGEIIDGMIHDTGYAESRRKLCEEAWPCRGKAAENIVDYLTEKRTQLCETRAAAQKTEET